MLIFMLLILSPSTVIHGLNDQKTFEDSYEEYDEEQPVNTTGYELVVPESFTSYLEQLLANDARDDKVNYCIPAEWVWKFKRESRGLIMVQVTRSWKT